MTSWDPGAHGSGRRVAPVQVEEGSLGASRRGCRAALAHMGAPHTATFTTSSLRVAGKEGSREEAFLGRKERGGRGKHPVRPRTGPPVQVSCVFSLEEGLRNIKEKEELKFSRTLQGPPR
ncbi:uncharacterized protein LOC105079746 isoform X1 [Camelus bactrianus]|uniref:Uncharacterized protein LOC105079746 isoform X1 n=1 Tax=Camelus bactrianus TaxID=9837 RepID=A0AC58QVK9_CAMBA